MKIPQTIFAWVIVLALLSACGSTATEPVATPQESGATGTTVPATEAPTTVAGPTSANEAEPTPLTLPEEEPVQTEEQAVLSSFSQPITATGEPLVLYGHVLDASGSPLSDYAVEIWQVDADGIYDHPGQANTANRDPGFQFYGTSLTDENGLFTFRTILPARYEPRPRHIHFKVKKDGSEVLTSQFYFAGDVDSAQLGPGGELLLLELNEAEDAGGNVVKLAFVNIVLNTGSGDSLTLTPSQTEGPFYPVVDVAPLDNDLASIQ